MQSAKMAGAESATLALRCDIVIATEFNRNSSWRLMRLGLIPVGGTRLLPRVAGRARAMGLALLQNQLSAGQALQMGEHLSNGTSQV